MRVIMCTLVLTQKSKQFVRRGEREREKERREGEGGKDELYYSRLMQSLDTWSRQGV